MIFKRYLFLIGLIVNLLLLTRCAQVIPLTGGPRDTKPPVLLAALPVDRSTNLPAKNLKIVFRFDEMVTTQNISQKLIINPQLSELPEVTTSGKTMTVAFDQELAPNTTYFLQFGGAVVDIHESNPYKGLTYIFSTGPSIDTAYITGKLTYALSQKPAADVSVMLYKNLDDSAPLKLKPDYITRSDEQGYYFLSAIKPGTYRVMAFGDKNKNQNYDLQETVGFAPAPISIAQDTLNLELSTGKSDKVFIKKKLQAFWGYNKYVLSDTLPNAYIITEKSIDTDKYQYEMRNDTLEVYYRELWDRNFEFVFKNEQTPFDTVSLALPGKARADSSQARGAAKLSVRTLKTSYGAKMDDVILNFSLPVKSLAPEKCFLFEDTVLVKPAFTNERSNLQENLVTTYLPLYERRLLTKLNAQKNYQALFLPGAIETFWGVRNADTLKATFKTFAADERGNLQVKLSLPDTIKTYVLQVLNEKGIVMSEAAGTRAKNTTQLFYNLAPADYTLRLISDKDQNQKFTPASYLKNTQAEEVYFYDKPVKIPAGWDVETEWKLIVEEKK